MWCYLSMSHLSGKLFYCLENKCAHKIHFYTHTHPYKHTRKKNTTRTLCILAYKAKHRHGQISAIRKTIWKWWEKKLPGASLIKLKLDTVLGFLTCRVADRFCVRLKRNVYCQRWIEKHSITMQNGQAKINTWIERRKKKHFFFQFVSSYKMPKVFVNCTIIVDFIIENGTKTIIKRSI